MRRRLLVPAVLTCVWLPACFNDLSWVDQTIHNARQADAASDGVGQEPDGSFSGGSGGTDSSGEPGDATTDTSDDALAQETASNDAVVPSDAQAACNPNEVPDEVKGVFVSQGALAGTGTARRPYASIAEALKAMGNKTIIYLDAKTYEEDTLVVSSDLAIRGGWQLKQGTWTRLCGADVASRTQIHSTSNVGVRVTDKQLLLQNLTLTTADGRQRPGMDGESTYGIWASGSNTFVQLVDVTVKAGKGGDGAASTTTAPGNPAPCAETTVGAACADGQGGVEGKAGADGKPGTFTAEGFQVSAAEPGESGTAGKNGTPGGPGATVTHVCALACSCVGGTCSRTEVTTENGKGGDGQCGCGGAGGGGGHAGRAGGASIAAFVTTGASLVLESSRLVAANGGKGTPGAPGSVGVDGKEARDGVPNPCYWGCELGACGSGCQLTRPDEAKGGSKGGKGGDGKSGGAGGAGAGGPSYAIVNQEKSVVLPGTSELSVGKGGVGGNDSSPLQGDARPRVTFAL